ncbi:MAG: HAD-IA family hydrolase [Bacillota bacterium]
MNKKYILFDLDGTILDSLPLIRQSFEQVFKQMDIPWGQGEVMQTVGLPLAEICRLFGKDRQQEMFERYLTFQDTVHDRIIRVFPGAIDCLAVLKEQNLPLGVVTSKRRRMTLRGLQITGLEKFFDVTVTMEDTSRHKPAADPVLKAMEQIRALPAATVYVGDSHFDIQAGKNAGVRTVGVTWGMAGPEHLKAHSPDHLVENWEELTRLLTTKI